MSLSINIEFIKTFCQKWGIQEFAVFGSALREDFTEKSDVDVMITLPLDHGRTFIDLIHMKYELETFFGRDVDLVTRQGILEGRNENRKKEILASAKVIYAKAG